MTTQLAEYLSARTDIDAQTTAYVAGYFRPLTTKRNAFLLTPGAVCKHYYFVNKGCLRLFSINDAGEEGTRYFAFEGSFGTALPSLIDQQPAFEFIQAIEPSDLLVIGRDDFFRLVDTVPPFAHIYRQILEAAFITAQQRIYGFQGLDAVDKVRWVMTNQPKILSRISNKMAASYLGLSPATLSRIKSKL